MEDLVAAFEELHLALDDENNGASIFASHSDEDMCSKMRAALDSGEDSFTVYKILQRFITQKEFTDLDFSHFMKINPSEPEFALKVMQKFSSEKASTITGLTINMLDDAPVEFPTYLDDRIFNEIVKLVNLENLRLESHRFDLCDLMKLCRQLPKLKVIKVVVSISSQLPVDDPLFAEDFRKSFMQLEEMNYTPTFALPLNQTCDAFQQKFTNFCVKTLPNIRSVTTTRVISMWEACKEFETPCKLQHLALKAVEIISFTQNLANFPSVEALYVLFEDQKRSLDDDHDIVNGIKLVKVPKLNQLWLQGSFSTKQLNLLLRTCGSALETLTIRNSPNNNIIINLELIRKCCPKLKVLDISNADVDDSKSLAAFASLYSLSIDFKPNVLRHAQLSNLLAAPNLTTVHFSRFRVTRLALTDTIGRIEKATILTKIITLSLVLDKSISEHMRTFLDKYINRFIGEVQNLRKDVFELEVKFC